jgi:serine/threonine-protein kinase
LVRPTIDPEKSTRLQREADGELQNGNLTEAIRLYGGAIDLNTLNVALYVLRGTALLRAGEPSAAARDFEIGLKIDPGNVTLVHLLSTAREALAARLQKEADAKRASGNLDEAIALYDRAIAVSPPNTALFFLRGTALLEVGEALRAAEDFAAGIKLEPSNATLQGLFERAQSAAKPKPDAARAAFLQREADEKRKNGDLSGAIALYDEALAMGPPNTALLFLRGTALLEIGEPAGAAQDFAAGLRVDPGNATLQSLFARAHSAITTQTDPARAAVLQREADVKRANGNLSGAIADYGDAIKISPPNTALFYLRGMARFEADDRNGAAEDFEAGLKLDPGNKALEHMLQRARSP